MSRTPTIKELHQQQQILKQRELGLVQRDAQLRKREEVEAAISKEQHRLHHLRRHQPQQSDEAVKLLAAQINTLEKKVADLKQQKVDVDHWLDDIEDVTEETLQNDRQQLAMLIISMYPEEEKIYTALGKHHEEIAAARHRVETVIELGDDITHYLTRAVAEGRSIRRGGFLRYIAGVNPNLVATACLTGIKTLSSQTKALLQSTDFAIPLDILSEDARANIVATLSFLEHKSQEKWRWRTFAADFQAALDRWNVQMDALRQALSTATELRDSAFARIDAWLLQERIQNSESRIQNGKGD